MRHEIAGDTLTLWPEGRIDSASAPVVEREILQACRDTGARTIRLDASGLDHISSAGLRIIMRLLKAGQPIEVVEVPDRVYDVFETCGMTELMEVRRAPRRISLKGLQQIGAGAFGRVYRLDSERVAKVYDTHAIDPDRIELEREVAREAFVHDIPSAIPFETVRADGLYGIVYELVDATTVGDAVSREPERCDQWAQRLAGLATRLHTTAFSSDRLPDARLIFHGWVDRAETSGLYGTETIRGLRAFVDSVPDARTFVHGDLHPANVMVSGTDLVLIDMGDASVGHPAIDLAGTYHVLRIAALRPQGAERLCGMSRELVDRFWPAFARAYFGTADVAELSRIERMLAYVALPRTMGSTARSRLIDDDTRRREAARLEHAFLKGCADLSWEALLPRCGTGA